MNNDDNDIKDNNPNTNILSTHDNKIDKTEKLLQSYQEGNHFGYLMLGTDNEKETPNTMFSTNIALHRAVEVMFT